jgi:tRNA A37 N6-isopentenylltransferase MiaA
MQEKFGIIVLSPTQNGLKKFNQLLHDKSSAILHKDLKKINPQAANRIHPNDSQHLFVGITHKIKS